MSCSTTQSKAQKVGQVYNANFSEVWEATVKMMAVYSLTVANRNEGLLESDWVSAESVDETFVYLKHKKFIVPQRFPASISKPSSESRSRMVVEVKPVNSKKTKYKVSVYKKLLSYNKFSGRYEKTASDRSEELAFLKNIEHKLWQIQLKNSKKGQE